MSRAVAQEQQERLANLALIWPRERWRPVMSTLLGTIEAGCGRLPTSTAEAKAEFLDALAAAEVAALSGWLKAEDLPVGFLDLALRVLDPEQRESASIDGPLLLCELARSRAQASFLQAGTIVSAAPAFTSEAELLLSTFDQMLDGLRGTLFDAETRLGFSYIAAGAAGPPPFTVQHLSTHDGANSLMLETEFGHLPPPSEVMLTGLWRFLRLVGRLSRQTFVPQEEGKLVESAFWCLLLPWTLLTQRRPELLSALSEEMTSFAGRRAEYSRLCSSAELAAVEEFQAGADAIMLNQCGDSSSIRAYADRTMNFSTVAGIRQRYWSRSDFL